MILGYWDIRGVSGGPQGLGRRRRVGKSWAVGLVQPEASTGLAAAEPLSLPHHLTWCWHVCVCVWVGGWLPCRVGGVGEGRGLRVWKPPGAVRVWQSRPDNCFLSWHLSQLAHAIRLLLEYTDSNYEEKKYTMGDGNSILFMS